jgi:hypothetical protein
MTPLSIQGLSTEHLSGEAPWPFRLFFPIICFLLLPLIPDSPRWLVRDNREEDVCKVLALLRGEGARPTDIAVREEASIIMETVRHEVAVEGSWGDMFKQGEQQILRRMLLGMSSQFVQQFTGVCAMTYYTPYILTESLKMSPRLAQIVGGCSSICFVLGCIASTAVIERQGRRQNALWGCVTCGLSMAGLCASTAVSQLVPHRQKEGAYAALTFVLLYYICYGLTWNGLPWVCPLTYKVATCIWCFIVPLCCYGFIQKANI